MSRTRIDAALERARTDAAAPTSAPPDGRPRSRRVAIGDPQAPFETFLRILDLHGLLGDDGRLRPEVHLVSMGDHFDWGGRPDRLRAAESALHLLAWLAAHPGDQVALLLGNHDLGRVCELASFDEASFTAAQAEADAAYHEGKTDFEREERFLSRYPHLPSAELLARDFSTFHTEQRSWVAALLRARRFRIALAASEDLLLCHAGVTRDDLQGIGLPANEQGHAPDVAAALNASLDEALARWTDGPLRLEPLHAPGGHGHREGRGIFYQRPACPEREPAENFNGPPRWRFDPRRLPEGLTQAIGHIRDAKCRKLLGRWAAAEPGEDGPLRHLRTEGGQVRYALGVPPPSSTGATLLFLDGAMAHCDVERYELLDLDSRRPARRG